MFDLVHIFDAGDDVLEFYFGENSTIARSIIERDRRCVATGVISDDYAFSMRMMNDRFSAEYKLDELSYDLGCSKIFKYSKRDLKTWTTGQLNILQRWLMLERSIELFIQRRIREQKQGDIKFGKTSIKTLMNQYEKLANLWNEIYDDDIMTPEELRVLTEKIHKCKIYPYDFEEFEKFVYEDVLTKGIIEYDDSIKIYNYVVKILELIKERVEYKQNEELKAIEQQV